MSDVTSDDAMIRVKDHGDSDDDAWCRVQLYWAVLILASCCSAEPSLSHYRPRARHLGVKAESSESEGGKAGSCLYITSAAAADKPRLMRGQAVRGSLSGSRYLGRVITRIPLVDPNFNVAIIQGGVTRTLTVNEGAEKILHFIAIYTRG